MKRLISCLLCLTILLNLVPINVLRVLATENDPYTIDNGYIRVEVSKKNGGFAINTEEGDLLKKSDNNKKLLFHNGEYDTSFVSYQVKYQDKSVEEYIFGGKYGNLSDPSRSGVKVEQENENGEIIASWSVGKLTFVQTISLANEASTEHGMVSISLTVLNSGSSPVEVKARMLLDSCLGEKDFAYYNVIKQSLGASLITNELVIVKDEEAIPQIYSMDDPLNAGIMAYTVNNPSDTPYQIAFGHWNNLASSLFNFVPNEGLDFTNSYNEYLTADSAYALYYDLGSVANASSAGIVSYYGVYSRHNVPAANSVAVDISAPLRLELNADKTDFIRLVDLGIADFGVGVILENYNSETAKELKNIALSIQTTSNLRVLSDNGTEVTDFEEIDPITVNYSNVKVGELISKTLYFEARPNQSATYERITISVYDISSTGGELALDYKIGEKVVYILLPGSDNGIPKVNFISMTPDIIYITGTRHLFVAITNAAMLDNRANWNLYAYSVDGKTMIEIPHSGIRISDGVMDVALGNEIELAPGSWYLQLEWTPEAVSDGLVAEEHQKQTANQLYFMVSEDKKYKNDSYGVLCVVEYDINHNIGKETETYTYNSLYRLEAFEDESAFQEFSKDKDKYVEILLVFRGEFTAERKIKDGAHEEVTYYTAVSTKRLDTQTREYIIDNTITINGCMDFEDGTLSVYYESYNDPKGFWNASIMVEFDGDLLTSDARTSIWKGKAIFTKIEQGSRYSLRKYDKNGNRLPNFGDQTIMLVWPSVYGLGQTLAGMIFKLAYGELGVIMDGDKEMGRVLSFTASFSKSFLNPKEGEKPRDTYWSKMQDLFKYHTSDHSLYKTVYGNDQINALGDFSTVKESEKDEVGWSASVMVQDVLFGCGKGFYGVHFKVEIGIQNYIENLPQVTGSLEVNTINDWAFKFAGGMELATFALEAKLSFKSRNNVPVPDDIYFYVGGFKPGINIDGYGVVWITGGGGGISNLYDTIFLNQALPPLKLIMSVGFSLLQMLDAKATLSIGLTGISIAATKVKILSMIDVIPKISLGLEWYPGIDLKAYMSVDLFQGVIEGNGYVVLVSKDYSDLFFEMYARASLKIPKSVPLVGDMNLLAVDLGLNTEKIWGGFEVLSIGYGITYYWGEMDVSFTSGGIKATPTYPGLLGQDDIPIYYDEERNQTLYAHFGTNISAPLEVEMIDLSSLPRLMDASLHTDPSYKLHKFNLGAYDANSKSAIVQISYNAQNEADAIAKARSFKIMDNMEPDGSLSGNAFPINLFDSDYAANTPQNADANANITFNESTGKAAFCFTVTKQEHYNKDWYISSGDTETDVLLYHVNPLPKVDTVTGTLNGSKIDLSWAGTSLGELDKISFFLSDTNDPEESDGGIPLKIEEDSSVVKGGSLEIDIPKDLPSGDYYIRAVYSKEGEINGVVFSDDKIKIENTNTPKPCIVSDFAPAGNLEYKLTIKEQADDSTDGYQVSIYNENNTATEIINLPYEKAASGNTSFTIGGSYEHEGNTIGLIAGKKYYASVTPYKLIDSNDNGEMDTVIYGVTTQTATIELPEKTRPEITIASDKLVTTVERIELRKDDNDPEGPALETIVEYITYTDSTLTLTASSNEIVTGKWSLDDAQIEEDPIAGALEKPKGTFTNTNEIVIPLSNLTEGSHTLEIKGNNAKGDSFRHVYAFDIDTTPPRLMLTTPVNGSFFEKDGKLLVSGVTDSDAHFTITSNQVTICSGLTIRELGGTVDSEGVFQFIIDIPDPNSSSIHDLVISVSDSAGNTLIKNISITHGGLADLDSLQVLVDGKVLLDGNIPTPALGQQSKQLSLLGVTSTGSLFQLNEKGNVSWLCQAVEGNASVDENGLLTMDEDAQGMLVGQLEVTRGAYRTVAMTFGAEPYTGTVAVSSTIGGTVTGGGNYSAGDEVTLVAKPDAGYTFSKWDIAGVAVADIYKTTITFVMPEEGNVLAYAEFKAIDPEEEVEEEVDEEPVPSSKVVDKEGELVQIQAPAGVNPNTFVPYYLDKEGNKVYVASSFVENGVLYFIAPIAGKYFFDENAITFKDTKDHWAKSSIDFMAARGLFIGIGDDQFAPNGTMTRAMFVTVLHRLAGQPEPKNKVTFQDIPSGIWYEKAVAWANENKIVNGMTDKTFAPDSLVTREQMCAMIARYVRFIKIGQSTGNMDENTLAFIDANEISDWALEDVEFCRSMGLVIGLPDNSFAPRVGSNRGENCTVFMRLIELLIKEAMKN